MTSRSFGETVLGRLPRLLVSGVDYNDFQSIRSRVHAASDWLREWEKMATVHRELGEEALQSGYGITAGQAFRRAAIYYHTGQSGYYEDPEEKYRVQQLQQAAYRKAIPHLQPPGRELKIPFEGKLFPAVLRLPPNVKKPPCVILNAGGDSTKEEFSTLEEEFLKRGLATVSYDGPGQSTTWRMMKLRPDFEKAVAAVIDELIRQEEIDPNRIGIWGRSFGGYSAPRAASFDSRLKACISIGGFFDMAETWSSFPEPVKEILRFAFGAASVEQAREMAAAYTLKGLLQNLRCPFLIVHSGMDDVCPVEASQRMQREAKGEATLKVFPEGNHVCDNIAYKVRPLMADWMAAQLSVGQLR
jgi:dipeptidyl aminopeptidase/acylaminoacyl peptidase